MLGKYNVILWKYGGIFGKWCVIFAKYTNTLGKYGGIYGQPVVFRAKMVLFWAYIVHLTAESATQAFCPSPRTPSSLTWETFQIHSWGAKHQSTWQEIGSTKINQAFGHVRSFSVGSVPGIDDRVLFCKLKVVLHKKYCLGINTFCLHTKNLDNLKLVKV